LTTSPAFRKAWFTRSDILSHMCASVQQSEKSNLRNGGTKTMARGKNIATNLGLRIKGWKAAVRSPKVPIWLKPGIRRAIQRAESRLRSRNNHRPKQRGVFSRKIKSTCPSEWPKGFQMSRSISKKILSRARPKVVHRNHIKAISASGYPHCRICGYRPRGSFYARSLSEQVIKHIRSKHRECALYIVFELNILLGQQKGDDSRCLFHGSARTVGGTGEAQS